MRKRDRKSLLTYSKEELDKLSFELRGEILDAVIHNGGHLSSNLGATDRTIPFCVLLTLFMMIFYSMSDIRLMLISS